MAVPGIGVPGYGSTRHRYGSTGHGRCQYRTYGISVPDICVPVPDRAMAVAGGGYGSTEHGYRTCATAVPDMGQLTCLR
eukprot:1715692-Rhodomonas_salina.3